MISDDIKLIERMKIWWSKNESKLNSRSCRGLVDSQSSKEWYISWDEKAHKVLSLSTDVSAYISSAKISTQYIKCVEQKEGNIYHLEFILLDDSLEENFYILGTALMAVAEAEPSSARAVAAVIKSFLLWKKMLDNGLRSATAYQGLLGELLVVKKFMDDGEDPALILQAWTGSDGSTEQDFLFSNKWYEVKTVLSNAMTVSISSLGQLDKPDSSGHLVVVKVDKLEQKTEGVISIREIIKEIKEAHLRSQPALSIKLDEKLQDYQGIILDGEARYWFKPSKMEFYSVQENFPMIPRSASRPEIKAVSYSLILGALDNWREE